jgi:hypothetical protein
MFPERRLLHELLNTVNRIVIKEMWVTIVAKVVWIGETILIHCAGFRSVDAHCVVHFVQHFENSVGRSEVADSCHCRVPDKLIDSSSAQVVRDTPLRKSILLLATKW